MFKRVRHHVSATITGQCDTDLHKWWIASSTTDDDPHYRVVSIDQTCILHGHPQAWARGPPPHLEMLSVFVH